MNFSFENHGTHTYLVYTVAENDTVDSMSLGMLTNNKLPGFAQTMFTQMDATQLIKYDVSAKVSAAQFLTGQVNKKRLVGVFHGIVDALLTAEDYMIDTDSIILDLNYIFTEVSSCETAMICLPLISDDLTKRDMSKFFKDIIFSVQIDPTENGDYFAKIINYLNASESFALEDFKKLLETLASPSGRPQPVPQPQFQARPQAQPQPQPQVKPQPQVQASVPPSRVSPTPNNMAIPGGATQIPTPSQPTAGAENNGQEMSLLWLLQHYNSDNAALYKEQKAAKKSKQMTGSGMAVPTKSAPPSPFSIPGQPTPPPAAAQPAARPQPPVQPMTPQPMAAPQPPQPAGQPVYTAPAMPQSQPMNFGETTVLGGGGASGETTVLGASPMTQVKPYLIRAKNGEKVNVDKPVFRIGKERSYVDYFIADNSAISRSHANIIERNGEYFIMDTNSTNHTYVNGTMSPSNVETKIAHGAKIRLANEDFEFKLY